MYTVSSKLDKKFTVGIHSQSIADKYFFIGQYICIDVYVYLCTPVSLYICAGIYE